MLEQAVPTRELQSVRGLMGLEEMNPVRQTVKHQHLEDHHSRNNLHNHTLGAALIPNHIYRDNESKLLL